MFLIDCCSLLNLLANAPFAPLWGERGHCLLKFLCVGCFVMYHKKLGRVHWLLWHLDPLFLKSYRLYYNYDKHCYLFYRSYIKKPYDLFIIIRSPKSCFRLTYANFITCNFIYKSFSSSYSCSKFMFELFLRNRPP